MPQMMCNNKSQTLMYRFYPYLGWHTDSRCRELMDMGVSCKNQRTTAKTDHLLRFFPVLGLAVNVSPRTLLACKLLIY